MLDSPPTPAQTYSAAHIVLDDFAHALGSGKGERMILGPTKLSGKRSRFCFVRLEGEHPYRFRVVVTSTTNNFVVAVHPS